MAKKIFFSDEEINEFLKSAQATLVEECLSLKKRKFQSDQDKEITFKIKMNEPKNEQRATLLFSASTWAKMYALINTYATEVEWHGTVERVNKNTFCVKDILVFPHSVTGATVTSDQKEYEEWLDTLDNETFNKLRFHGHSHVNMGVTPSGVDMGYRKNVLNNFGTPTEKTDHFYIFLIGNKKGETSGEIYDLQNNVLYGTSDIDIKVDLGNGEFLNTFLENAKPLVKEHKFNEYTKPIYDNKPATTGYGSGGFGYYGALQPEKKPCAPTPAVPPMVGAKESARRESLASEDNLRGQFYGGSDYWKNIYGR